MDVHQAIETAKKYVAEVYSSEEVSNLGLEETEYDSAHTSWLITIAFSRPWNAPRTRAQEVLATMGAITPLKRSYKVVTISQDGSVLSMKNRVSEDAAA